MTEVPVGGFDLGNAFLGSLKPKFAAAIALDVLSPTRRSFRDLTGVMAFDVPLGFAYDPYASTLNDVAFRPWSGADETLWVALRAPVCPASAGDDEWYEELEEHGPGVADLGGRRRFRSRGRPCLLGEKPQPEAAPSHVAWIRSPRLDLLVEHRGGARGGAGLTAAMSKVLGSLELPSKGAAAPATDEELLEALAPALHAMEEDRLDDFADLAMDAVELGRRSAASGDLERYGAGTWAIVQMASRIGVMCGSVPVLRSAEHLLLRSLRTFDLADDAALAAARDTLTPLVQATYTGMHDAYEDLRTSETGGSLPELPSPTNPVQAALVRIRVLLGYAEEMRDAALIPPHWAQTCVDLAVQDGLLNAAWWNAAAAGLIQDAPPSPPEPRLASLAMLQSALELRIDHERASGLVSPETGGLAVEIARLGAELHPGSEPPTVAPDLARALALQASALVSLGDEPSADDASSAVEEASRLLESVPDHDDTRSRVELIQAILSLRDGAFDQAVEHGRRATAAAETAGLTELAAGALTVAARAFLAAGRAEDALAELDRMPKGEAVGAFSGTDVRVRALAATGEVETALNLLTLTLAGNSIGGKSASAETFMALFAGADILEVTDPPHALDLLLTAQAIATLWKASSLRAPADRIGFNEGDAQVRLGANLVTRLLEQGKPADALLAADRSRAETLNQSLGMGEDRQAPPELPPLVDAPAETGDVVDRLASVASVVRREAFGALAALGVPAPPEWPELSAVLAELGAAALVPQPSVDGLTVFLALPDGEIRSHRSAVSADELSDLIAAAQDHLHVEAVARSADRAHTPPVVDARRAPLDDVLRRLHGAIVEPMEDAIAEGLPLLVVPYRELALVPWALLLDRDGHHLCEQHPLSQLPSLATLVQLRHRRVQRSRPDTAYVVGAPTSASDLALPALPGAREEAEYVAAAVHGMGAAAPRIRLRLAEEATKASYRAEAADADFVHLACHAALRTPAQASPLFLAASPDDDGLLFAPEIAEIGLSDALVFLSACQTGLGRPTADGVIGLGRAFLEAGARCVVLSLWEVSDAATAALVRHFVGRFLDPASERLDAAGALRSAMLATREDLRAGRLTYGRGTALVDHPKNWGPFVVLGDGSFGYRE